MMDVDDAYEMSHDEFDEKLEKEWFLFEDREAVMTKFFQRVKAARAEEKEGIGSEEEGDAEDPPVTMQRLLLKFCGKWSDGRSEYEVILDPGKLNSCTVCTRRPNGDIIETRGLIKCNRYTGCITWGKHYELRTDWRLRGPGQAPARPQQGPARPSQATSQTAPGPPGSPPSVRNGEYRDQE
jgi:hypothetical protein